MEVLGMTIEEGMARYDPILNYAKDVVQRKCIVCGTPLGRKRWANGQMEPLRTYAQRITCGGDCAKKRRRETFLRG